LNLEFTEEAATFESEIEALKKEKNNQREGIEKLEADLTLFRIFVIEFLETL